MDWANVKWKFSDDTIQILPVQIVMFIDIERTIKLNNYDMSEIKCQTSSVGRYWAVVKSTKCKYPTTINESNIAKYYLMEDDIHMVSCLNIVGHANVIIDEDFDMIDDPLMSTGELECVITISDM